MEEYLLIYNNEVYHVEGWICRLHEVQEGDTISKKTKDLLFKETVGYLGLLAYLHNNLCNN